MYIYCITNINNGKSYIGKCQRSVNSSKAYYGSGVTIKAAIKKYGKDKFTKVILEENIENKELLSKREIYWINSWGTKSPNGYNLTDGGEGTFNLSEKSRKRISEKNKKYTGEKNSRYGAKLTEKHKQILRETDLGKKVSKETLYKMKFINLGKKFSKETRMKMSNSKKGCYHKQESILNIRKNQPNCIPVVQYTLEDEFIKEYVSTAEAMRQTGVFNGSILNCCKGKLKTAGKFKWKYL